MMKRFVSLFGGKGSSPTDPKEIFAAEVEQFLRSLPAVTKVTRVAGDFAFEVITPSGARRAHLDNAFAESREMSPEERRAKIAFFFASVVAEEHNESWDDARRTFVPVLRGATYGLEMWATQPEAAFVRRPFLPYVDIVVAMDRPTSMSFVGGNALTRWQVDERALFEAATARVPLLAGASVERYDDTHGPLWMVSSNDSYESSRLLAPGWLASFRGKVEGAPIAIIPERATLMVGGDARPAMIERLIDKAEREFGASNRRLSPALYSVDEAGNVVPYMRPPGDPLAIKLILGHEKLAIYEYQQQTAVLDKLHEKNGPDVFVANYQVFQGPDDLPRSLSVWTKGVRSYLPRTSRVMLLVLGASRGDKPKLTVEVPFAAIADRLTRVAGLHPPRFETTGDFPSDNELRLLGASPTAA